MKELQINIYLVMKAAYAITYASKQKLKMLLERLFLKLNMTSQDDPLTKYSVIGIYIAWVGVH